MTDSQKKKGREAKSRTPEVYERTHCGISLISRFSRSQAVSLLPTVAGTSRKRPHNPCSSRVLHPTLQETPNE